MLWFIYLFIFFVFLFPSYVLILPYKIQIALLCTPDFST